MLNIQEISESENGRKMTKEEVESFMVYNVNNPYIEKSMKNKIRREMQKRKYGEEELYILTNRHKLDSKKSKFLGSTAYTVVELGKKRNLGEEETFKWCLDEFFEWFVDLDDDKKKQEYKDDTKKLINSLYKELSQNRLETLVSIFYNCDLMKLSLEQQCK